MKKSTIRPLSERATKTPLTDLRPKQARQPSPGRSLLSTLSSGPQQPAHIQRLQSTIGNQQVTRLLQSSAIHEHMETHTSLSHSDTIQRSSLPGVIQRYSPKESEVGTYFQVNYLNKWFALKLHKITSFGYEFVMGNGIITVDQWNIRKTTGGLTIGSTSHNQSNEMYLSSDEESQSDEPNEKEQTTDKIISGHGAFNRNMLESDPHHKRQKLTHFKVPEGMEIIFYAPPGAALENSVANTIEHGKIPTHDQLMLKHKDTSKTKELPRPYPYKMGAGEEVINFTVSHPDMLEVHGKPYIVPSGQKKSLWQIVNEFKKQKITTIHYACCSSGFASEKSGLFEKYGGYYVGYKPSPANKVQQKIQLQRYATCHAIAPQMPSLQWQRPALRQTGSPVGSHLLIQRMPPDKPKQDYRPNLVWGEWFASLSQEQIVEAVSDLGLLRPLASFEQMNESLRRNHKQQIQIPQQYLQQQHQPYMQVDSHTSPNSKTKASSKKGIFEYKGNRGNQYKSIIEMFEKIPKAKTLIDEALAGGSITIKTDSSDDTRWDRKQRIIFVSNKNKKDQNAAAILFELANAGNAHNHTDAIEQQLEILSATEVKLTGKDFIYVAQEMEKDEFISLKKYAEVIESMKQVPQSMSLKTLKEKYSDLLEKSGELSYQAFVRQNRNSKHTVDLAEAQYTAYTGESGIPRLPYEYAEPGNFDQYQSSQNQSNKRVSSRLKGKVKQILEEEEQELGKVNPELLKASYSPNTSSNAPSSKQQVKEKAYQSPSTGTSQSNAMQVSEPTLTIQNSPLESVQLTASSGEVRLQVSTTSAGGKITLKTKLYPNQVGIDGPGGYILVGGKKAVPYLFDPKGPSISFTWQE